MIESILINYSLGLIFLAILLIIGGYILPLMQYKIPVQFAGIIMLCFMVFMAGKGAERQTWETRNAELKLEIASLEAKSEKISTETIVKYVDKIKYIDKINTVVTKEFIPVAADQKCEINQGFVSLHDSTVKGITPTVAATDSQASTVKLSDVGETVKGNYVIALKNKEQLIALQNWIREQEKLRK